MYAGTESVGAEDAWFDTALHLELYRATNAPYSGSAADTYKCFDQVTRPLLYHVAKVAGLPPQLITAYRNFQEHLLIHNSLGLGLGTATPAPTAYPKAARSP